MPIIDVDDLPAAVQSNELIDAMVAGANGSAERVAPCLFTTDPAPTASQLAEAKLVLIGSITRWAQAGSGAFQQEQAGPFGVQVDTRQRTGFNLWPSEITHLIDVCKSGTSSGAFSIDTVGTAQIHADVCALNFGALYCSCMADIAGFPLYEDYSA